MEKVEELQNEAERVSEIIGGSHVEIQKVVTWAETEA